MSGSSRTAPRDLGAVAVRLFERVATGESVELAVLSGVERCVLGQPAYALLERPVRLAWDGFGETRRTKATELSLAGMSERGLIRREVGDDAAEPAASLWSMSPELGIVQAAQRKPAYLVVTEVEGKKTRGLRFFAIGDQEQPVCGVVVEEPVALPTGSYKNVETLGPLGWMTRYRLVSEGQAVGILTDMALTPRQDRGGTYPYGIRRFQRPEGGAVVEAGISVVGAGSAARVRRFSAEQSDREVFAVKADVLHSLLGRLLATGAW
ncbi:hypothetical protein [Catenulispora pinisilvae]|uniref:hypothetical protein n=1 Tax=Catenulispora pinisilvae TaxID=2705253 RepID=UPI0018917CE7|nr:hypothetical protein [Catenulispora pinisilvae]